MARPVRIELPGALYYVSSLSGSRAPIVKGDGDRYVWLEVLEEVLARYGWRCHAWCLMDDGCHLVVETPQPNLSLGMRQLNGVYSQRFKARHKVKGQLFQRRFKSLIIEKGEPLLKVLGYMVSLPVLGGKVRLPAEYEWSSYAETQGARKARKWLEPSLVLGLLGKNRTEARREFARRVEGNEESYLPPSKLAVAQSFIGSEEFIERVKEQSARAGETSDEERNSDKPHNEERASKLARLAKLFTPRPKERAERDRRIAKAHREGFTLAEIGGAVGLHYGHVSKIVKRQERGQSTDTPLLFLME